MKGSGLMFFSTFAGLDFHSILPMCENCDYQQHRKCPPLCLRAHFSIHKTEISGVPFVQITESQNSVSWKGSRRIKSNPYVNGPYRDQTHVCRSGLATGLPCSFTQHIFLLPPNKGGGSWWQLRCFGAAVVLLGL